MKTFTFTASRRIVFGVLAVAVIATPGPAYADLPPLNSSSFLYKYEQEVSPATQDLDSNGTVDFTLDKSASSSWTFGDVDGADTVSTLTSGGSPYAVLDSGTTGAQIWTAHFSAAAGYTIESRVKITPTSGTSPTWLTMARTEADNVHVDLGADFVRYRTGGGTYTTLTTPDNTDAYHTFRIAHLENFSIFQLWRDGVQIGVDLPAWTGDTGTYFRLGDAGGAHAGTDSIDYVRFTPGAYAPGIVEPLDGDYNNDSVVDAADYVLWRKGLSPDPSQAGYDLWRQNFGKVAGVGSVVAAVPEPSGLVLVLAAIGASVMGVGRRRPL